MKLYLKITFILLISLLSGSNAFAMFRYVGGDISLLPEYEKAGAVYKDENGKRISDLIPFLSDCGMNAMRVRLFVNPDEYLAANPDADKNACQSLEYIIPLCKRITEAGMSLMLDFHYSDTWADPAAQWTPDRWKDLSDDDLAVKIGQYTESVLKELKDNGITPSFIQPGNEISYGMLWGIPDDENPKKVFTSSSANWKRFASLLNSAIAKCREVCPDAKIIIHSERTGHNAELRTFYYNLISEKVDFDIIGLSYYPYFHCPLSSLDSTLSYLEKNLGNYPVMIVETGFPYKWEVPGTTEKVDYEYSEEGQDKFAADLVETLRKHENVDGLFWWWLEYNAYGTNLSGWYNAPLFDSTTGKACKALKTICSFADGNDSSINAVSQDETDGNIWYRLDGTRDDNKTLPGIYLSKNRKIIVR